MTLNDPKQNRRRYAAQLGGLVSHVGDKSFRRRGFVHSQIVTQWSHIVGPSLASVSAPEGLRFPPGKKRGATLTIRADSSAGLELQHHLPLILERVNMYFGYSAVEKLSIRQGPLPQSHHYAATRPKPRTLKPGEEAVIDETLKPITDQSLKAALARLGSTVFSQS